MPVVDEKLFDDAIRLAALWLTNSKAKSSREYRDEVEGSVQAVYEGLVSLRARLVANLG